MERRVERGLMLRKMLEGKMSKLGSENECLCFRAYVSRASGGLVEKVPYNDR